MTGTARRDESIAASGARWITTAFVLVGLLNYGYAVLLTHLLNVSAYSSFAAGQGLILWASTVATVSVPWVLAQALARAQSDTERHGATRFAMMASAGSGIIAAAIVGTIGSRFGGSATALVLALSTLVIFLGTTTTGWLQGWERMRGLSALYVGENLLKNGVGVLLVVVVGLRDTGALAAFGIGGVVMLLWWPRVPRGSGRPWLAALSNRDLWCRAGRMAAAQGLVSLLAVIDVVLVALLPGDRALAASYQASAALSRVPLFVAGAVATAFFPSLSRRVTEGMITARALRMYTAVALPFTAVLVTMPAPILAAVFPAQYGAMATLLKFTAVTGLAAGGVSLVTAFFQAANDYSCLWWLGAGLAGYVGALLAGWQFDGITGLAAGGAVGATVALLLLAYRLVHFQGSTVLALVPLVEPVITAGALVFLRMHPAVWLAAAILVGLRTAARFVHPGARHARKPGLTAHRYGRMSDRSAVSLLTDTVWRGTARNATDAELHRALVLARTNRVEGRFASAYPVHLPDVLAEVRVADDLFARNLRQVVERLDYAGIPAVLINVKRPGDHISTNIDMAVSAPYCCSVLTVLADWYVYSSTYRLGRSTRVALYPPLGPALHLHTGTSWFGIPVLRTERLIARAHRNRHGFLIPAPDDFLRICLAHALFQGQPLYLSELLNVRDLMRPNVITAARAEAIWEGWPNGFDRALATVHRALRRLDRGLPIGLPVTLPASLFLEAKTEHARYWNSVGKVGPVDWEAAALRVPPAATEGQRR
jgi:O-antigen/teichoic acid export membrane protein